MIEVTKDEKGRTIHRKSHNYEIWKEYDDRGNLVRCLSSAGMFLTWDYDENNRLIEFRGSDEWYNKYTYYDNGQLQWENHYKNGEDIQRWYDEEGELVHSEYIPAIPVTKNIVWYGNWDEEDDVYYPKEDEDDIYLDIYPYEDYPSDDEEDDYDYDTE